MSVAASLFIFVRRADRLRCALLSHHTIFIDAMPAFAQRGPTITNAHTLRATRGKRRYTRAAR